MRHLPKPSHSKNDPDPQLVSSLAAAITESITSLACSDIPKPRWLPYSRAINNIKLPDQIKDLVLSHLKKQPHQDLHQGLALFLDQGKCLTLAIQIISKIHGETKTSTLFHAPQVMAADIAIDLQKRIQTRQLTEQFKPFFCKQLVNHERFEAVIALNSGACDSSFHQVSFEALHNIKAAEIPPTNQLLNKYQFVKNLLLQYAQNVKLPDGLPLLPFKNRTALIEECFQSFNPWSRRDLSSVEIVLPPYIDSHYSLDKSLYKSALQLSQATGVLWCNGSKSGACDGWQKMSLGEAGHAATKDLNQNMNDGLVADFASEGALRLVQQSLNNFIQKTCPEAPYCRTAGSIATAGLFQPVGLYLAAETASDPRFLRALQKDLAIQTLPSILRTHWFVSSYLVLPGVTSLATHRSVQEPSRVQRGQAIFQRLSGCTLTPTMNGATIIFELPRLRTLFADSLRMTVKQLNLDLHAAILEGYDTQKQAATVTISDDLLTDPAFIGTLRRSRELQQHLKRLYQLDRKLSNHQDGIHSTLETGTMPQMHLPQIVRDPKVDLEKGFKASSLSQCLHRALKNTLWDYRETIDDNILINDIHRGFSVASLHQTILGYSFTDLLNLPTLQSEIAEKLQTELSIHVQEQLQHLDLDSQTKQLLEGPAFENSLTKHLSQALNAFADHIDNDKNAVGDVKNLIGGGTQSIKDIFHQIGFPDMKITRDYATVTLTGEFSARELFNWLEDFCHNTTPALRYPALYQGTGGGMVAIAIPIMTISSPLLAKELEKPHIQERLREIALLDRIDPDRELSAIFSQDQHSDTDNAS